MKKTLLVAALAAIVLLVSGCDMFRRMAGRPTSKDIAAKRAMIEWKEKEKAAAEAAAADTAALASVAEAVEEPAAPVRYTIILGAFKEKANAEKLAAKAGAEGYPAELVTYSSGMTVVSVCPSATLEDARRALEEISDKSFFQKNAWIKEKK